MKENKIDKITIEDFDEKTMKSLYLFSKWYVEEYEKFQVHKKEYDSNKKTRGKRWQIKKQKIHLLQHANYFIEYLNGELFIPSI